jgi:hypothetical protein
MVNTQSGLVTPGVHDLVRRDDLMASRMLGYDIAKWWTEKAVLQRCLESLRGACMKVSYCRIYVLTPY